MEAVSSPALRQRRPSRAETRDRLLDAAIEVFIERGIGAASIEEITDAAGFSRGAFYSNFTDKDALVMALLERGTEQSALSLEQAIADHPDDDADTFVDVIQRMLASPRWTARPPALQAELMLFALRVPEARPFLRQRLERARAATLAVVEHVAEAHGLAPAANRATIADMINAIEMGFDFQALLDPDFDARHAFSVALAFLTEAGAAIATVERLQDGEPPSAP